MPTLNDLLLVAGGAVTTAVWYGVKRKIERSSSSEALNLKSKVLDIYQRLCEQDLTPDDLKRMEDELLDLPSTQNLMNAGGSQAEPVVSVKLVEMLAIHAGNEALSGLSAFCRISFRWRFRPTNDCGLY